MGTALFNGSGSGYINLPGDKKAKLADISVSSGGGTKTAKLPIVAISEMSHHNRQQLDCSLDGTIHILAAAGGLGVCQITFMDRVQGCKGTSESSLSALHQYDRLRKKLSGAQVKVRILDADGSSAIATFKGVVKSCTASASNKQGIDVLLVTYSMQGVMDCG